MEFFAHFQYCLLKRSLPSSFQWCQQSIRHYTLFYKETMSIDGQSTIRLKLRHVFKSYPDSVCWLSARHSLRQLIQFTRQYSFMTYNIFSQLPHQEQPRRSQYIYKELFCIKCLSYVMGLVYYKPYKTLIYAKSYRFCTLKKTWFYTPRYDLI